jgi:hypothetical protein
MIDIQPIYTPLIPDPTTRYRLAWIFIFLYIGLFLFNLGAILGPMIAKAKCYIKLKTVSSNRMIEAKGKVKSKAKECCTKKKTKKVKIE